MQCFHRFALDAEIMETKIPTSAISVSPYQDVTILTAHNTEGGGGGGSGGQSGEYQRPSLNNNYSALLTRSNILSIGNSHYQQNSSWSELGIWLKYRDGIILTTGLETGDRRPYWLTRSKDSVKNYSMYRTLNKMFLVASIDLNIYGRGHGVTWVRANTSSMTMIINIANS